MTLDTLAGKLSREYARIREEETKSYYKASPKHAKTFMQLASKVEEVVQTDADIAALVRAAFSVKWWMKSKGEWESSSVPYPNQLLRVEKYLALYQKLRVNGEDYDLKARAMQSVERSYWRIKTLAKSTGKFGTIHFFLMNDTISHYYALAHPTYFSELELLVMALPSDSKGYLLYEELRSLKDKLVSAGVLGYIKSKFKELDGR